MVSKKCFEWNNDFHSNEIFNEITLMSHERSSFPFALSNWKRSSLFSVLFWNDFSKISKLSIFLKIIISVNLTKNLNHFDFQGREQI